MLRCHHKLPLLAGLEVQTVRVATNILSQITDPTEALQLAPHLEACALAHDLTFLSLGSTGSNGIHYLSKPGALSSLAASLRFTSFSVAWQDGWTFSEAKSLAREIFLMANGPTPGANFRFGCAFNCPPGIPYFPVATAGAERGFALGLENSGLLYTALSKAGAENPGNLEAAHAEVAATFEAALTPLLTEALSLQSTYNETYLGIDTSIAPALEPPDIASAFASLGLGAFGGSGTLAVAERITAAIKSLPEAFKLCGYCGLMLPVCEDLGLASAAANNEISLQTLLLYSAVCGVGLDTVPIPGPSPSATAGEVAVFEDNVAAVLMDTAALSRRLKKPLTVRLLPVPGAQPGQQTAFNNPYLVDSAVMPL